MEPPPFVPLISPGLAPNEQMLSYRAQVASTDAAFSRALQDEEGWYSNIYTIITCTKGDFCA